MEREPTERYFVHLTKVRDPFNELCEDLAIELHENILEKLGWDENTIVECSIKLGHAGNVLVIERYKELDNL